MSSAGDVNGDGFADVIVGSPGYSSNTGRVYLYMGSRTGLSLSGPISTNVPNSRFGESVASAGDVNNDGYGDIIVGAPKDSTSYSEQGRAFVYLGSSTGQLSGPTVCPFEGVPQSAHFGASVASAGDVDGDGYGDVIVGANTYTNVQSQEGKVFIIRGGSSGLQGILWQKESDTASAQLGTAVGSAGDVDGDGLGDVVVSATGSGAPNGQIYVHVGRSLSSQPWSMTGPPGSSFGLSLARAGDVNGDGYGDIVVGAPLEDVSSFTDAGRVYVHYGNGGDLTVSPFAAKPHAHRPNTQKRIPLWGSSSLTNSFQISMRARSPHGRTRVKIQYEVKPSGSILNGTGLITATSWTDTINASGADLSPTVTGLVINGRYHWRARVLFDPTRTSGALRSRWFWGGVSGQSSTTSSQAMRS